MYQGVLVTYITNHYPIFHISHFYDNQANNLDKFFLRRKINEININAFRNTVINFESSAVNDSSLVKLVDYHFPITKIKYRYNDELTWLTIGLKLSLKTKHKLCITYKMNKTAFNEMQCIT